MGDRTYLGSHHPRHEPVFLLPLPRCQRHRGTLVSRGVYSYERAFSDTVVIPVQIVAQLISFPVGRAWAKFVPNYTVFGVQLNPGPFNVKEHVLITIMASVGSGSAYAVCQRVPTPCTSSALMKPVVQTDIVAVQRVYYNQIYNFGCESSLFHSNKDWLTAHLVPIDQWMVVMSTQLVRIRHSDPRD